MKNQELHELKTSELERFADQIKPFFEKYSSVIYAAAGATLLLIVGTIYFKYKEPANAGEWRSFYTAAHADSKKSAQSYATLAEDYPNTIVGKWSALKQADGALNDGLRLMFVDRKTAKESIKRAGVDYNKLIESNVASNDIVERALFGLARVAEASCSGNTDEPIKQYERLIKQFPESMYTPFAKTRIEALKKKQTREFYAWFSEKKPTAPDRTGIKDTIDNMIKKEDSNKSDNKTEIVPSQNPFPKKDADKKEEAKIEGDNPFKKETAKEKPANNNTTKNNPKPKIKKSPGTTIAPPKKEK